MLLLTLSLPRVINIKFLLQPHQKYYITLYEELGFSSLTQMQDDKYYQFSLPSIEQFYLQDWENVLFELGSERIKTAVKCVFHSSHPQFDKLLMSMFSSLRREQRTCCRRIPPQFLEGYAFHVFLFVLVLVFLVPFLLLSSCDRISLPQIH